MPKFSSSPDAPAAAAPKFRAGFGGGTFPKVPELFGELIMLTPLVVEKAPGYKDGPPVDRLTADVVVFSGEFRGEHPGMWWSKTSIVKAGKEALRRDDGTILLGRLRRFPQRTNRDKYPTPDDIDAAIMSSKPTDPSIDFAWALEQASADDEALATKFLGGDRSMLAADDDGGDSDFED